MMRNSLLMGVMVSALALVAVPARAQVADDEGYVSDSSYGPYRPAGFGVQVYGGGSANEYGPYGYADRGYGPYAEPGFRPTASSLTDAVDCGREDGYEAGTNAARFGWRYEPYRHRYYQSPRGWAPRVGERDVYDGDYRRGFRSGYDEGFRAARRHRGW